MSGATTALVCTHCEVTFRLRTPAVDVHYRCIRCRRSVGPGARAGAGTLWLYSGDILQRTNTFDPGQTWGGHRQESQLPHFKRVGRYELVEEVGRGGMGVVYLAYDPISECHVALKVLLAGDFAHQVQSERFLREARAVAQLSHRAIVPVREIGEFNGQPFFAMDFIESVTLRAVIDSAVSLPVREACRIAAEIARALAEAHASGFAHRDVKPANILVKCDGRPYITDFGLVIETDASRLTQTGAVMGTPAYMAPELARGDPKPDFEKADVYALGAVLYEMITGQRPYRGDAGMQVLLDILADPPVPISSLLTLDRDVTVIVERAMARDASYRYPDANALAEDLTRYVTGQPIAARPLPKRYRAIQFGKRYRRPLFAIASTIGLTVMGTAGIWMVQELAQNRAELHRETVAEERRATMTARVDDLLLEGRPDQARQAFLTFTSAEAHAGTRALGRAWLGHAERERAHGRLEQELTALGTAFTTTSDPGFQDETLLEIARTFRRQWWWNRIDAALDLIQGDDPELLAAVHDLRVETSVALRNLDGALALVREAGSSNQAGESATFGPLLATLAKGTPLGRETTLADAVDIDGDGVRELVLIPERVTDPLIAFSTRLQEIQRIDDVEPAYTNLVALDPDAGLFVAGRRGQVSAYRWTSLGLNPVGSWEDEGALTTTAAVDVDGDGIRNLYLGFGAYTRHLAELVIGDPTLGVPHPPTDRAQSDISAMTGMDLTGDDQDELIVAAGPWNAWDLRVLIHDGEGLELGDRSKIGYVTGLTQIRRGHENLLVATKSDIYPSVRAFPKETPYGSPAGIYLLGWEDDGLVQRDFLPAPAPAGERTMRTANPVALDVDGDGRQDLAVNGATPTQTYLLVYRQLPDGRFARLAIGGLRLLTTFDNQLVVAVSSKSSRTSGAVWLLGQGDQFPEPLRAQRHAPTPQSEMPRTELGTWQRAESLLSMGLIRQSATTLEELGTLVDGTELAGRAWLRAGVIREEADDVDAALRNYNEATSTPIVAAAASLASARLLFAENRFEASRVFAERLRSNPDLEIAAAVEALWPAGRAETPTPVTRIRFDRPLATEWRTNPLAVRRDAIAGTLVIDVVTGHGVVAKLPLRKVGPLAISIDLTLERLEWASGIEVRLQPLEQPKRHAMGIAIGGWGGGGLLDREVGCKLPGRPRAAGTRAAISGASERIRLHGDLRGSYAQDSLSCRITSDTGKNEHTSNHAVALDTDLVDWELVITSSGDEATNAAMLTQIEIAGIDIEGAVIARDPRPDTDPLLPVGSEGPVASERLADEAADLVRGLRSRRELLVPHARESLGRDYFNSYAAAWLTVAEMHPDDEVVQQALLADLEGLREWVPQTPAEHNIRRQLLYLRGRARWRSSQAEAARADMQAILRDRAPPDDDASAEVRFQAHRLLAAIAIARGDEATALRHAAEALSAARSPELGLDRLLVEPSLSQMRDAPGWESIFGG